MEKVKSVMRDGQCVCVDDSGCEEGEQCRDGQCRDGWIGMTVERAKNAAFVVDALVVSVCLM